VEERLCVLLQFKQSLK